MVAYSFKKRFVTPIRVGLGLPVRDEDQDHDGATILLPKRQTIRAVGKRRHALPGEAVQLYTGMRTQICRMIGVARCKEVRDIVLTFREPCTVAIGSASLQQRHAYYFGDELNEFARRDGFAGWPDMVAFWRSEHGHAEIFFGVLVEWEPIT